MSAAILFPTPAPPRILDDVEAAFYAAMYGEAGIKTRTLVHCDGRGHYYATVEPVDSKSEISHPIGKDRQGG